MENIKTYLTYVGKALSFIAIIFVGYKLYSEISLEEFIHRFDVLKVYIIPLIIVNAISILLGIYSWYYIISINTIKKSPFIVFVFYFLKTEIAKYIPGNIFHIVGRQLIAKKLHISQKYMIKSSIIFAFLTLFSSLIVSSILYILHKNIYFSVIVIIINLLFFIFIKNYKIILNLIFSNFFQALLLGILIYYKQSLNIYETSLIMSIYLLSWIVGFITPGASGGIGIRESSFIFLMTNLNITIPQSDILFFIVFIRVINIITDIILFLFTFLIDIKSYEIN